MKHLIAMFAIAMFAAVPLVAQEAEGEVIELPSGEKVRIVEKDGVRIIKPVDKDTETTEEAELRKASERKTEATKKVEDIEEAELEDDFETDMRKQIKKALERARKDMDRAEEWPELPDSEFPEDLKQRMEEMRKRMEELRKEFEKDLEKSREEWEDEDGNDVEKEVEEYESPDGRVKIKIVRIRKVSKSSEKSETPEAPKKTEKPREQ